MIVSCLYVVYLTKNPKSSVLWKFNKNEVQYLIQVIK